MHELDGRLDVRIGSLARQLTEINGSELRDSRVASGPKLPAPLGSMLGALLDEMVKVKSAEPFGPVVSQSNIGLNE